MLAAAGKRVLIAWQTKDQIFYSAIDDKTLRPGAPIAAPGTTKARKHPALAGSARGETMLVWTEGTGWNQGGSLAWQKYGESGKPSGDTGHVDGVPVWGLTTVVARPDGRFTIFY